MPNADRDAIYARVSTGRQEKEKTIEAQLHAIREKFGREGRILHETYLDQNVSGTVLKRPGLDACLAAARSGKFNRLLVDHPDRLARGDAWMRPFMERDFADAGVRIEYASYTRQDSSEGQMLDDMVNAFSAYERRQIMRRMAAGRASKLARGAVWRAQRPYGWRYEPPAAGERDGRMLPIPEELRVVRAIFEWVLAGKTSYWIAEELNRAGHRTAAGGPWHAKAVQRVIAEPMHTGMAPTNPCQPEAEWQWVEIGPAIVSRQEWQQARVQLSANKKLSKRNATHEYLLRGILRCGQPIDGQPGKVCGRVLTGQAGRGTKRWYRCSRKKGLDGACDHSCKGRCDADVIEEEVWDAVVDSLTHPEQVITEWQRQQAGTDAEIERLAAQLAAAHDRHNAAQAQLDALLDLRLTGEVDPPTFARKQAELTSLRESCQGEIAHLERQLDETGRAQTDQHQIASLLRAMMTERFGWEVGGVITVSAEEQQAFIRQVVRAVWVMPGGYRVDLRVAEAATAGADVTLGRSPLWPSHNHHTTSRPHEFCWSIEVAA